MLKSLAPYAPALFGCLLVFAVAACASLPKGQTATTPDAAAIRLEGAVATVATALTIAADDPAFTPADKAKAADYIGQAFDVLKEGRGVFDARSGDPAGLAAKAMALVDRAIPANVSPRVQTGLTVARVALGVYAASVVPTGAPAAPSAELVAARGRADQAVGALLVRLRPG